MAVFRSAVFNILLVIWCIAAPILFLPTVIFGPKVSVYAAKGWAYGCVFLARLICGISYEIKGKEFVPDFPCIVASKHQSAWETIAFFILLPRPVFILKKELLYLPFLNIFIYCLGSIRLDRSGGGKALKDMVRQAKDRISKGMQVIIFPEGTRTKIGEKREYKGGVSMIYSGTDAKIVPVALNSALYWPKNSFIKKPGKITVEFLPHIAAALKRDEMLRKLETEIETACARLEEIR